MPSAPLPLSSIGARHRRCRRSAATTSGRRARTPTVPRSPATARRTRGSPLARAGDAPRCVLPRAARAPGSTRNGPRGRVRRRGPARWPSVTDSRSSSSRHAPSSDDAEEVVGAVRKTLCRAEELREFGDGQVLLHVEAERGEQFPGLITPETKPVRLTAPGHGSACPPRAWEHRGAGDHAGVEVVEEETAAGRGQRRDVRHGLAYGGLAEKEGNAPPRDEAPRVQAEAVLAH